MIHIRKNSRWFWSVLGAAIALQTLPGCKQMSVGRIQNPSPPTPYVDPFASPAPAQRFSAPELTPVPALPAPGHTEPMDPSPLPPSPAPTQPNSNQGGGPTEASAKPSWKKWNIRSLNYFGRKPTKTETQPVTSSVSTDESVSAEPLHSTPAQVIASRQWKPSRRAADGPTLALPSQSTDASGNSDSPEGAPGLDSDSESASHASATGERYAPPIITPGPQYLLNQDDTVNDWPHAPKSSVPSSAVHFRKPLPQRNAEDFAPVDAGSTDAGSTNESSAASVPLLLPPGP
jgi:hypothetical protein